MRKMTTVEEKNENSKIRILCIDDNEDDFKIIKKSLDMFMKKDVDINWASTWHTGLKELRENSYDLLILDYLLPEMNGLEIIKLLHNEEIEIPIIMLTGGGDEHVAVNAMKQGVSDYLIKDDLGTEKLSESVCQVVDLNHFKKEWDVGFSDLIGSSKRDSLSIIGNILSASTHGINKTRLVYKANLNFQSVKKYLAFLINNGFLSVVFIDGKETYKTTEEGLRMLRQIHNLKEKLG